LPCLVRQLAGMHGPKNIDRPRVKGAFSPDRRADEDRAGLK
jgi:hypothetical protein